MKVADPDIMLAADGHLYVNAASLPVADRAGRRVVRCVSLTPGEEEELRRRIGEKVEHEYTNATITTIARVPAALDTGIAELFRPLSRPS
jgi:hypothetical protein